MLKKTPIRPASAPGPSKPGQDIVVTKRVGDARRSDNAFWPRTWTRQPTPFQVNSAGLVSTSLAGTRVFFDDAEAPLLYVQEGQINVVAPYTLPARKKPRYKSSFKVNGRMLSRYQSATRIHPSSEASQPCFRYSSRKTEFKLRKQSCGSRVGDHVLYHGNRSNRSAEFGRTDRRCTVTPGPRSSVRTDSGTTGRGDLCRRYSRRRKRRPTISSARTYGHSGRDRAFSDSPWRRHIRHQQLVIKRNE
jgi:hypothetical protein